MSDSEKVTDAELLAEIEKEALDALKNETLSNNNNGTNGTLNGNNNNYTNMNNDSNTKINYNGGAQLTTFQDNIITTGSEVSKLLMFILLHRNKPFRMNLLYVV